MGSKHSWQDPKSPVTDQLVYEVAGVIVNGIQGSTNGLFTASITDIRLAHGNPNDDEYGTYLHAINQACKRYKIEWDKAGPNGRKYRMDPADMAAYLAGQAILTGNYQTTMQVTLTCPCCNQPTTYEVQFKPVAHTKV